MATSPPGIKVLLLVLVAACLLFPACTEDKSEPADGLLLIVGKEYAFELPREVKAGLATVRLANEGREIHNAALIRLTDGRTVDDLTAWMAQSLHPPPWAVHVGGVESIPPGREAEAVVELKPGPHAIVCYYGETGGNPHYEQGMVASFHVVEAEGEAIAVDADLDLVMYDFGYYLSDSLREGRQTIRVVGAGPQIHNVLVWRLNEGYTVADLSAWLESDRTSPRPAQPRGGLTALSPGEEAYLVLDLEPGQYALVCLVKDREDNRTHLAHGMVHEFSVAEKGGVP